MSCGTPGSPEHSHSPAPRTAPSPPGQPRGVQEEPLAFPAPFGTGAPCPAAGSPLPRALAAPARYLGADEDLPEQGLDVVVGSSHDDRDLVSGEDVLDVPQSGSTSRGAGCGGLQAAAGPDPCGHPMILGPRPPPPAHRASEAAEQGRGSPSSPTRATKTQGHAGTTREGSTRLSTAGRSEGPAQGCKKLRAPLARSILWKQVGSPKEPRAGANTELSPRAVCGAGKPESAMPGSPQLEGYQRHGPVPEIHHRVVGDEGIHEADHVVPAELLLLRRNLVCDDVQALVHLGKRRARCPPLCVSLMKPPGPAPSPRPNPSLPPPPPAPQDLRGAAQEAAGAPSPQGRGNPASSCWGRDASSGAWLS